MFEKNYLSSINLCLIIHLCCLSSCTQSLARPIMCRQMLTVRATRGLCRGRKVLVLWVTRPALLDATDTHCPATLTPLPVVWRAFTAESSTTPLSLLLGRHATAAVPTLSCCIQVLYELPFIEMDY